MIIQTEKAFDRDYVKLPENVQALAEKQLALLLENPRHPSLQNAKNERLQKFVGRSNLDPLPLYVQD